MMKAEENKKKKTLVLGGTGKTGSRVAQRLVQLGWPVSIGSRSAEIPFDWENPTTWKAALQDIDTVYITFQPDLAVPGAVEAIRTFTQVAVESGVQKLVLLSGRGEVEALRCEQEIMNSGTDWTVIRASWFCQNFSEGYLLEPLLAGHVALPVGDVGEPFIDVDDIADVAVAALTEEGHSNQLYEVTGPRLLTFKQALEEIAEITGKTIQFQQVSTKEYESMLTKYGLPKEYITFLIYLFTKVMDGRNASLTDGVQRALGRKPTDFAAYVHKTAKTRIWEQFLV